MNRREATECEVPIERTFDLLPSPVATQAAADLGGLADSALAMAAQCASATNDVTTT